MHQYRRTLLPQTEEHSRQRYLEDDAHNIRRKRRRKNIRIACNSCRSKKCGCDGVRPICSQCIERGTSCEFITDNLDDTPSQALKRKIEDLQQELNDQTELLDHLKYSPENEAFQLLQSLRSTSDPSLRQSSTEGITREGSQGPDDSGQDLSPQDSLEFEVDLLVYSQTTLADLIPLDNAIVSTEPLLRSPVERLPYYENAAPPSNSSYSGPATSHFSTLGASTYAGLCDPVLWQEAPMLEESDLGPPFTRPM